MQSLNIASEHDLATVETRPTTGHRAPEPGPRGEDDRRAGFVEHLLATGGVSSRFQPLVELVPDQRHGGHRLRGFECLCRGPEGSAFRPPRKLFAAARFAGVTATVDRLAASAALAIAGEHGLGTRLYLNVEASTLERDRRFTRWLTRRIEDEGRSTHSVTVEIVEHSPVRDPGDLTRAVLELRGAGMAVALDDVGEGHANHGMILATRPQVFKIDRRVTTGLPSSPAHRALAAGVLAMAREAGAIVVLEGIERAEQLASFLDLGADPARDLGQGFLFAPALEPGVAAALERSGAIEPEPVTSDRASATP